MEKIVCSAVWYKDGKERIHNPINTPTGLVVCGLRHHNCFGILAAIYPNGDYKAQNEQGFLTTKNRFVSREEGAHIALAADQIVFEKEHVLRVPYLYSENLW